MSDWTVLEIYGGAYDQIVVQALNRYGLKVWTPLGKCLPPKRPSSLWKEFKPAFVGYAFVEMIEGWEKVLSISAVHGVLMNDEQSVVVRSSVINLIKKDEALHKFDERPPVKQSRRGTLVKAEDVEPVIPKKAIAVSPGLPAGTEVYIGSGPFSGRTGTITRELKKGRYAVDVGGKQAKLRFDLLMYLADKQK